MQLFTCPFCGEREEGEFLFAAEAGKQRPEPVNAVSDARWANYLYMNDAPRGQASEIWIHLTCGEFFLMTRNTVTREVIETAALPGRRK